MEMGKHSDMQHLLIEVDKSMIWAVILKWLGNSIRVKTIKGDIWSLQGGIVNPEEGKMGPKTLPCHLWGVCITQGTTSKLTFLNFKVLPMNSPALSSQPGSGTFHQAYRSGCQGSLATSLGVGHFYLYAFFFYIYLKIPLHY